MKTQKFQSLPIQKYEFTAITSDIATARIYVCHDSYNPNGSFFETSSFEKSKKTFQNKPVVGYIKKEDIEGETIDFGGHDYEESPIGSIPETNRFSIKKLEDGRNWVIVDAIIYKQYAKEAYELLSENGEKKISMEIEVVDGKVEEDGFLHVKQFNLLCITVLGDDVKPAMGDNALITLTSKNEEFALKFSNIIVEANKIASEISSKGGKIMNKDEIIAKFSNLQNVEGYQKIVDNKELSFEELEKQLMSLSVYQTMSAIREELSKQKITKQYYDGELYETCKYYLEDIVDAITIAYDCEAGYYVGIPFSMNGDKAELKYEEAKRYTIGDWREYQEGDSNIESFSLIEKENKELFEKAKESIENHFNVEETKQYKDLSAKYSTAQDTIKNLNTENSSLQATINTLQQFKDETLEKEAQAQAQARKEAENQLFAKYSKLEKIGEFNELKEKVSEFENLNDFEKELKVLAFDNKIQIEEVFNTQQFSNKNNDPINIPVDNVNKFSQEDEQIKFEKERYGL